MAGSPWGTIQSSFNITWGVRAVSTAGHGGLMIAPGFANKYLSDIAREYAERYGGYYCYEEDCACTIPLYEIYSHPELRDVAEEDVRSRFHTGHTVEDERENLHDYVEKYYPGYSSSLHSPSTI